MKALLTPRLLGYLIMKGYQFFLCQTTYKNQEDTYADITLKPVKKHPLLQNLPEPFSAYCSIFYKPFQMVTGMPSTRVLVELNARDLENFQTFQ